MTAHTFHLEARTIAAEAQVTGVGLHSGTPCTVALRPAPPGAGVTFSRAGPLSPAASRPPRPTCVGLGDRVTSPAVGAGRERPFSLPRLACDAITDRHLVPGGSLERLPARWDLADAPGGQTRLPGVATPEHLLAAIFGLGITDLTVALTGPELPHLDGSALPWVQALGTPVITGTTVGRAPDRPVRVEAFGGVASLTPSDRLELAVEIDFGPGLRGRFEIDVTPATFATQIAPARTFLPHASLDAVQAAGRGVGAGPGSVVLWGARGPLVPLRFPDEPVRHKALDALGDLALAGPVRGRLEVVRGTHALHLALLAAWLRPS